MTLDCVPCLLRQSLETARMTTEDPALHERILREVAAMLADASWSAPPPLLAGRVHERIRAHTGVADAYRSVKERCTLAALDALPRLRRRVAASSDPLEAAVRLAIAGNAFDFGAPGGTRTPAALDAAEEILYQPFAIDDLDELRERARSARRIAYFADNAGEIVLDRLLIEILGPDRTTVVVRGAPILNDATLDDARASGLSGWVDVLPNGLDLPGTSIERSSPAVRQLFEEADLLISKGQGNFETLSGTGREGLFFLLKVKCPLLAAHLACEQGDIVVRGSRAG